MTETPEFDQFRVELRNLRRHPLLKKLVAGKQVHLGRLVIEDIAALMLHEAAKYFLFAAAGLNRTGLKKAAKEPESAIVEKKLRQAYAIKRRLPVKEPFDDVVARAEAVRRGDLGRKARGGIEALFRERLVAEGIPVLMAPPIRAVPGLLVTRRKPDGVWPDPSTDRPPIVYLEIKNLRRVADDIQKRLYEIAEASLEMKLLYGNLVLRGLSLPSTEKVLEGMDGLRQKLRSQIVGVRPAVVASSCVRKRKPRSTARVPRRSSIGCSSRRRSKSALPICERSPRMQVRRRRGPRPGAEAGDPAAGAAAATPAAARAPAGASRAAADPPPSRPARA